jgi:hypothetical protein
LVYADDVNLLGDDIKTIKETVAEPLLGKGRKISSYTIAVGR